MGAAGGFVLPALPALIHFGMFNCLRVSGPPTPTVARSWFPPLSSSDRSKGRPVSLPAMHTCLRAGAAMLFPVQSQKPKHSRAEGFIPSHPGKLWMSRALLGSASAGATDSPSPPARLFVPGFRPPG